MTCLGKHPSHQQVNVFEMAAPSSADMQNSALLRDVKIKACPSLPAMTSGYKCCSFIQRKKPSRAWPIQMRRRRTHSSPPSQKLSAQRVPTTQSPYHGAAGRCLACTLNMPSTRRRSQVCGLGQTKKGALRCNCRKSRGISNDFVRLIDPPAVVGFASRDEVVRKTNQKIATAIHFVGSNWHQASPRSWCYKLSSCYTP